ncbi:RING-H2 finger protein ATL67-like [Dioscorea cayenensis subsp. rotundata]|uniref:RING-H2 finger protein ATL67-like n=1 Tax=Dioscorea cayennensis subsp. rotundata TaxID=55577 RepID=A0AB40BI83_DIOCR|nr:RING-H2 finger protein ATL67-like [Dioscorea cayenensis subsp. rotundata]
MSSSFSSPGATTPSSHLSQTLSPLSHTYTAAIAVSVLLVLSALLLVSYLCYRSASRQPIPNPNPNSNSNSNPSNGVTLPRIIFVTEDDDGDGNGGQHSPVPGLDPAAINSYPKFPFSAEKGGDVVCSICLCEYRDGEMLRMMPDCRHYFHLMCIDAWLRLNASCPVCRTSPMPTPLSTPLSELVPLSQFPAGRRRS